MSERKIVTSVPVDLPDGRKVRVLAYDDGSIRFRVTGGGPYVIEEAYIQAKGPDQHAIVKLTPALKEEVALFLGTLKEEVAVFLRNHQLTHEVIAFGDRAERIGRPRSYARAVGQCNSWLSLEIGHMFPGAELVVYSDGQVPGSEPYRDEAVRLLREMHGKTVTRGPGGGYLVAVG